MEWFDIIDEDCKKYEISKDGFVRNKTSKKY
jgi:hypothetical protein